MLRHAHSRQSVTISLRTLVVCCLIEQSKAQQVVIGRENSVVLVCVYLSKGVKAIKNVHL